MTTKNNQSTMKPIRFKNDLLELVGRVMGEGESFAQFTHEACKALSVERLRTLELSNTEKICGQCHKLKPKIQFNVDRKRNNKVSSICKSCKAEYDKNRIAKSKD